MVTEVWADVKGFEGLYSISNLGRVRGNDRKARHNTAAEQIVHGRILRPFVTRNGYEMVHLCSGTGRRNGKRKLVHRLVAEAFIPKRTGANVVNHIDSNRRNNAASNLEWCTAQENVAHAFEHGDAGERCREVVATKIDDGSVLRFDSIRKAAQQTGAGETKIVACCRKYPGRKSAGGYRWEYAME